MNAIPDAAALPSVWRKSSYSGAENQDCVEVADNFPGAVPIRDSKAPHGPALLFTPSVFSTFVTAIKAGQMGVR